MAKYGLSVEEWREIIDRQGGACFVCRKVPTSGRLCIDHEHVKGWKAMPPEKRKLFCRGALCFFCNKYYVGRSISVEKSKRVTEYLESYAKRWVSEWLPR